ncbi:MAG: NPCBM/NEW2 domain-containing protein [Planctomycetota bacterium]
MNRSTRMLLSWLVRASLLLVALASSAVAQPHQLVENFTAALPAGNGIRAETDAADPKVGLAAARLHYAIDPKARVAALDCGGDRRTFAGPGTLKLWVKGDASGNELELALREGRLQTTPDGRQTLAVQREFNLPRLKLDFDGWREVEFNVPAAAAGSVSWLQWIRVHAAAKEPKLSGTIGLDELRLSPAAAPPNAQVAVGWIGADVREFGVPMELFLDARNFTKAPASVRARVQVTDRNDNTVATREFTGQLAANEQQEFRWDLAPENLAAFLPPFRITGDVMSPELPDLTARIDVRLVMGNSRYLFDDMGDAAARWFTAGSPISPRGNLGGWFGWTHGEAQRASPLVQTEARIARVAVQPENGKPPGAYALQIEYAGDAVAYNGGRRHLPGNAYRAGFWVKGDGSNSRLFALFLDFTDGGNAMGGGPNRTQQGEREIATLDFTDWRYFEVLLPGRGLGANTPRGSTLEIDFPIELTALRIEAAEPNKKGSVQIGPILVSTQLPLADSLAVHVASDDPTHGWRPDANATATIQNSSLVAPRKTRAQWTLLDRAGQAIGSGQADLDLAIGEAKSIPLALAGLAPAAAGRLAPFTLQVTAFDQADGSVTTTREIVLTRADSQMVVADFEADRGYLGPKDIDKGPADGAPAARTSAEQAHGGGRSLAIQWSKPGLAQRLVSIDPPLPGIPIDLSVWVHGDESGVLVYPLVGDRTGITNGPPNNWFLPRTEGEFQNAVRVDWKGWREVRFTLPPPAPGWSGGGKPLPFTPNYPLGVHLAVDARTATTDSGRVFIDDLAIRTQLPPEQRIALVLDRSSESNVLPPGSPLTVMLSNLGLEQTRRVAVTGGLFDWRGDRIAGIDREIDLAAGAREAIQIAKDFPPGFYRVRVEVHAAGASEPLATVEEDLLAADPAAVLGPQWIGLIADEWRLRKPVGATFNVVDEDWDWVEHHPGNLQVDTIKMRANRVTAGGGEPFLLLGYSAFWAAQGGLEQVKAGTLVRPLRDRGHAVSTFMLPERLDDWDNFVHEVMRGAADSVSGWMLWDGPDSSGPLAFPPDKLLPFLRVTDKWRRTYAADKPLYLSGLGRETAIPYLYELGKAGGLECLTGANVRLDVGRLSPEDAGVVAYARDLRAVLNPPGTKQPRSILFTDLDWAVEKDPAGLNAFDQAAYLARAALLLDAPDIRSVIELRNEDFTRVGLGLAYRRTLVVPPLVEMLPAYQFKPAYWGLAQVRQWLAEAPVAERFEVADIIPGRTRAVLQGGGNVAHVIVWRNDDAGQLSFAGTGATVTEARDLFGAPVPEQDGWYSIGKVPCRFAVGAGAEPLATALALLRVRDAVESTWPQQVLAAFRPDQGGRQKYRQAGGQPLTIAGRTVTGEPREVPGVVFKPGGSEAFAVAVPAGSGLVLKKQFLLDDTGQAAEVVVNGSPVGTWDLRRSEKELSGGLRESIFVIDSQALGGRPEAEVAIRYSTPANTTTWTAFEWRGDNFPLSAVGAVHADQNVGTPRYARNIVGGPLKIDREAFTNGIGAYARSLQEIPLNGQFRRFTSKVGVDAVTEGRGSVTFEVYGDGKKLWASPLMSGLDGPRGLDLDVTGVNRLRLVVTDANDGNKFDAANWVEPELKR